MSIRKEYMTFCKEQNKVAEDSISRKIEFLVHRRKWMRQIQRNYLQLLNDTKEQGLICLAEEEIINEVRYLNQEIEIYTLAIKIQKSLDSK